jgi:hypothetical protein
MSENQVSKQSRLSTYGLTRSQVAHQLGVSTTEVHRMRLRGDLQPKRDDRGVWRYNPAEVVRLAAKRGLAGVRTPGQVAAHAFRMFDHGGDLRDIVLALQVPPEEVRRLYREWQSSLDDPSPAPERPGAGLLDEEPGAEEAFNRAIAQAAGLAMPPTPKPRK